MAESKEIRWRKIGGGSLRYIRGKIIKPNEVFIAKPEEIPRIFRKQVVALEDIQEALDIDADIAPVKPFVARRKESSEMEDGAYETKARSRGWWNVVNKASGKVINEKGLREDAAKELVAELNA